MRSTGTTWRSSSAQARHAVLGGDVQLRQLVLAPGGSSYTQQLLDAEPFQDGFLATPAQQGATSSAGLLANGKAAMELQGHWNPGVMQSLTPDQKVPSFLGWFPFPNVPGSKALPGSLLGGGDGFACSWKAPQPACAQFLAYIDSPSVQRRIGATSFGLPVRKGTESSVKDPNLRTVLQVPLELAVHPALPRHRVFAGDRAGARRGDRRPVRGQGDSAAGRRQDRSVRQEEVARRGSGDSRRNDGRSRRERDRPVVDVSRRRWLEIAIFLAPALALYVVFLIVPVVQAVHYSVYSWNGLGALTDFVGSRQLPRGIRRPALPRRRWGTT